MVAAGPCAAPGSGGGERVLAGVAGAVGPEAEKLVMVHPQRVKAIASAPLKNDKVDSETLAHLSRADLLPEASMANQRTQQTGL